jgi:hypothetical protein
MHAGRIYKNGDNAAKEIIKETAASYKLAAVPGIVTDV